ncbi:DJ-1/PfpI family protein [Saccharothrix coeruleofusca]|nr:DJ-1/PfpI family protein [Saccharothrix coeruleofusca]
MAAPVASAANPLRVQVLVFEGVEEQDFAGPVEVLGIAGRRSNGALTSTLVTPDRPGGITCNFGTRLEVAKGWSPHEADVLVVPGGGLASREGSAVRRLIEDRRFLRRLADADLLHVGVCTGSTVLAAAGLTRGRNATTHTSDKAYLAAQGANVINARVVDDGDLITGGGVSSGLDVALWLVERFLGAQLAQGVETIMEYERRGTVWRA